MNYLVWRQHRYQLRFAAAALAALALVLVPTGIHLASAYRAAITGCAAAGTCGDIGGSLFRNYAILFDVVGLTAVVPALFGLFWGAPLVAAEIEAGTHLLAWTQTVTRRRWLAVKVGWVISAAAVWGAAMTVLVTWWSGPVNSVEQTRFDLGHFDTQGLVPVAYSVFAVALGVTAGLVLRRVLPALAATLGAFTVVRFAVDYGLRPHYLPAITKVVPLGSAATIATGSYWPLGSRIIDPMGRAGNGFHFVAQNLPAACRGLIGEDSLTRCLGAHGWRVLATYQPANRFWTFQVIETGLYLLLAALLLMLAFRQLSRRDA